MTERGHTYKDEILEKLKSPDIKMGELLEIKSVAGENWRIYNGKEPITAQILTEKASGDVGGFPATPTTMNFPALDETYVTGAFKGLFYSEALPGYIGKKMFLYGGTTKGTSYWDYHFNLIDMDTIATPVYSFRAQSGLSASNIEINDVIGVFYSDYYKQIIVSYQVTRSGIKRYGYQWCKITDGTTDGGYASADVSPHPNAVFSLYQAPNDITSLYMAEYDVDNKKLYLRKYLNFNSMSSISTFAKDLHDFTKYDRTYDLELLADSKPILFWDNTNSKIMVQWQVADGTTYIGDFADPITTQVQLGNTTNTLKNTSMYTSQEGKSSLLMLGGKRYDFSKVGLPPGVSALPANMIWVGGKTCTAGKVRVWFYNESDSTYYNMLYNTTLNKIEYISLGGWQDNPRDLVRSENGVKPYYPTQQPVFLGSGGGRELWKFTFFNPIFSDDKSKYYCQYRTWDILVCISAESGSVVWTWGNGGNVNWKNNGFDWDSLIFNTWLATNISPDNPQRDFVYTFSFIARGSCDIPEIADKLLFYYHDLSKYDTNKYTESPLMYSFCWANVEDVLSCNTKADLVALLSSGFVNYFSEAGGVTMQTSASYSIYEQGTFLIDGAAFIKKADGTIAMQYTYYWYRSSTFKHYTFYINFSNDNIDGISLTKELENTITANVNIHRQMYGWQDSPSSLLSGSFDFGNTAYPYDKALMSFGDTDQFPRNLYFIGRSQSGNFWNTTKLNKKYMYYISPTLPRKHMLAMGSAMATGADLSCVFAYITGYVDSYQYPEKRYCKALRYIHDGAAWQQKETFHLSLEGYASTLKLSATEASSLVVIDTTNFTACFFTIAQDNSLYVLKTGVPDGTLKSAIGCDLQSPTTFYSQPLNTASLPLASYPTTQGIMLIDYKGTMSKVLIDITGDSYQEYNFIPYPFIRESIKSEKDNLARTIKLGIPETTENHLMSLVNSGEEMRTKEVNIYRVFLDDDDKPVGPAVNLFSGHIESWEYIADKKAATLKLSHDMFSFKQPCPRHAFTMRCRHRFKGVRCGYSGAETHCDKSLTRCQALNNEARFGGFPWVAMRQRRVLWR
ncbi:hypothetical protein [Aminobacterium colombiense]